MEKKNRLRFSIEDDLCLLREVLMLNPFNSPTEWVKIHKAVVEATRKDFSTRTLRDHLDYLLKLFSKEDWANRKKSGTEEQYTEREFLLQDIRDLAREFKATAKEKGSKTEKQNATKYRQFAAAASFTSIDTSVNKNHSDESQVYYAVGADNNLEGFDLSDEEATLPESITLELPSWRNVELPPSRPAPRAQITADPPIIQPADQPPVHPADPRILGPSHKRVGRATSKESALDYLHQKNSAELELRKRQMEVEERKIALEEKRFKLEEAKFDLDKMERLKRLEMEEKNKENQRFVVRQQQELMALVLNNNKK